MPVSFLNEAERDRLNRFPGQISDKDLVMFFALSASGGNKSSKSLESCHEFSNHIEYRIHERGYRTAQKRRP